MIMATNVNIGPDLRRPPMISYANRSSCDAVNVCAHNTASIHQLFLSASTAVLKMRILCYRYSQMKHTPPAIMISIEAREGLKRSAVNCNLRIDSIDLDQLCWICSKD